VRHRLRQCPGGKGGPLTGPNPTDRGKPGSKIHLITDRNGLPLSLGISGANMHDSLGLKPLVRGIPPIRSRRGPRRRRPAKLHADKGYDYDHLRRWLRKRGIRHRIARKGIESSQRLDRHRWVVERTVSWLAGCRRLHRRYERKAEHFLAFVAIAAALIGHRRLAQGQAGQPSATNGCEQGKTKTRRSTSSQQISTN
jgi:transposase